jgi:hypothetical protein
MTISPDDARKLPLGRALAGWVRAMASRFVNYGELEGLDRTEFAQIARDLNLSPPELYAISTGGNLSAGLLNKRMAEFGLSPELVKKQHPEVSRDLERVCGMCSSKKRCAAEFEQQGSDPSRSDYCPNTQTLQALEGESLMIEERATLPLGPACC